MKTCFLGTGGYTGKVAFRGWPTPPELCEREEAAKSMDTALWQYKSAEAAGFDWVSISEHHYSPGLMTPNPIVLGAAVSQQTSRVKIAMLGPLVPLLNPVRAAEELAMLDALSHGRVVVLFLRGTPNEHRTYEGREPGEAREMTQEGVQLIRRAWTEPQPFAHAGKYFNYPNVAVWPRTVQDPHPPIFYSGNSEESAVFAGRHHLNCAIGFAPPPVVKRQVDIYKAAAREAGWEPTPDNVLYRGRMLLGETDEDAHEMASQVAPMARAPAPVGAGAPAPAVSPQVGGQGGGDPTAGVAGIQLLGGVDTVAAKARVLHEAGVGILDIGVAGGGLKRTFELFHSRLQPALAQIG